MNKMDFHTPSELKTAGTTPFLNYLHKPLFRVSADVPIGEALTQASDLLCLVQSLSKEAAFDTEADRHAWAAHFLTQMSKALIDDVVTVVNRQADQSTLQVQT